MNYYIQNFWTSADEINPDVFKAFSKATYLGSYPRQSGPGRGYILIERTPDGPLFRIYLASPGKWLTITTKSTFSAYQEEMIEFLHWLEAKTIVSLPIRRFRL